MRYIAGFALLLPAIIALPVSVSAQAGEGATSSVGFALHAQHHLPPQLMSRASHFYYVDPGSPNAFAFIPEHLEQRVPGHKYEKTEKVTPTEQSQKRKLSRGAKAGIAVGAIVGGGLIGLGVAYAATTSNFEL